MDIIPESLSSSRISSWAFPYDSPHKLFALNGLTVGQSLTVSCQDVGPSLAGDRSSCDLDKVTRSKSKSLYCR